MTVVFAYDNTYYDKITNRNLLICGKDTGAMWPPFSLEKSEFENYSFDIKILPVKVCIKNNWPFIYPVSFRQHVRSYNYDYKNNYSHSFNWITEEIRDRLRHGQALLLLDDKFEGFPMHYGNTYQLLHSISYLLKVPARSIIFTTSNLKANYQYQCWADANRVTDRVKVISDNYFESATPLMLKHVTDTVSFNTLIDKTFLCLNRHFNDVRELFVFDLFKNNMLKDGYVSLPKDENRLYEFTSSKAYKRWTSSTDEIISYISAAEAFIKQLPLVVDISNFNENQTMTVNIDWYNKSFCSVINETHFSENTLFFSEKTFKAIYLMHPFIIFGSPLMIDRLHQMGYRTFSPIINEDYDTELSLEKRKNMILFELKRLSSFSFNRLQEMRTMLIEILVHNRKTLLSHFGSFGGEIQKYYASYMTPLLKKNRLF